MKNNKHYTNVAEDGNLICPLCGRRDFLTLKGHFKAKDSGHNMSEQQYQEYKKAHHEVKMVSDEYHKRRSYLFKEFWKDEQKRANVMIGMRSEEDKTNHLKVQYIDSDKRLAIKIATEIDEQNILSLESDRFIELLAYHIGTFRQRGEDRVQGKEDIISELELTVKERESRVQELEKENLEILKLVNNVTLCLRSGKESNSPHHVISREFEGTFGKDKVYFSVKNIEYMEGHAHTEIQEPSDKYIKQKLNNGGNVDIEKLQKELRYYYFHGFPGEGSEKIDEERISNIYDVLVKKDFSKEDASAYSVLINDVMGDRVGG